MLIGEAITKSQYWLNALENGEVPFIKQEELKEFLYVSRYYLQKQIAEEKRMRNEK